MLKMFTSNKKGITLTEVLFSAGILAIVATGILFVFVQTMDVSGRINYEYKATNLAKSRIERARTVITTNGFDSLVDLEEVDTLLDENGASNLNGNFKRSTDITTSYNGDIRLTQIDVDVIYKYKDEWKDAAVIGITTVFTNIE